MSRAPYFTLVLEGEGEVTLTIQRGIQYTLSVSEKDQVQYVSRPYGRILSDGEELRGTIPGELRDIRFFWIKGMAHLIRSSNPDVIAVELDETNPDNYYLVPVGFGEATLFMESDQYYGELTLLVKDWQVTLDATHSDYGSIGLPPSERDPMPTILPRTPFEGTLEDPFPIPCLTEVGVTRQRYPYLWQDHWTGRRIRTSDPDIVRVVEAGFEYAYLEPVNPGACIISYQQGPFLKEVVVRSDPGYLNESHFSSPGFYAYYGSAHVRRDSVVLEDSRPLWDLSPIVTCGNWSRWTRANFIFLPPA